MQLVIKKKKYFFEILKKKSLNPELNNTSYDKGKKRFLPPKYLKKKFTRIRYQYFTTKEKKDFSIEIFKKKSRNLAFDINILQQRKRKISSIEIFKKNLATLRSISIFYNKGKKRIPSIEILKKKPRVSKPAGIRHQYREINLRVLGSIKNTILGVTNPCKKIVSIRHKDYI